LDQPEGRIVTRILCWTPPRRSGSERSPLLHRADESDEVGQVKFDGLPIDAVLKDVLPPVATACSRLQSELRTW
jgi:hypothetical protein